MSSARVCQSPPPSGKLMLTLSVRTCTLKTWRPASSLPRKKPRFEEYWVSPVADLVCLCSTPSTTRRDITNLWSAMMAVRYVAMTTTAWSRWTSCWRPGQSVHAFLSQESVKPSRACTEEMIDASALEAGSVVVVAGAWVGAAVETGRGAGRSSPPFWRQTGAGPPVITVPGIRQTGGLVVMNAGLSVTPRHLTAEAHSSSESTSCPFLQPSAPKGICSWSALRATKSSIVE
mmetsp:Transcript_24100/g.63584  ORF Transcript_24100/g.63584 Transcript_24100/m.63584 type:complete len:232 (+) Transcript_24100:2908-3603(+)